MRKEKFYNYKKDLEYDEVNKHYRYELKIKFGRYKDE